MIRCIPNRSPLCSPAHFPQSNLFISPSGRSTRLGQLQDQVNHENWWVTLIRARTHTHIERERKTHMHRCACPCTRIHKNSYIHSTKISKWWSNYSIMTSYESHSQFWVIIIEVYFNFYRHNHILNRDFFFSLQADHILYKIKYFQCFGISAKLFRVTFRK